LFEKKVSNSFAPIRLFAVCTNFDPGFGKRIGANESGISSPFGQNYCRISRPEVPAPLSAAVILTQLQTKPYSVPMKAMLAVSFVLALTRFCFAGELKVATVDLQRVTAEYYRAQEVARELELKEVSFVKELEGLRLEGRRLTNEAEDLRKLSLDIALSATEREAKRRSLEMKLADVYEFDARFQEVKRQREVEFQAQSARLRRSVLDEVVAATRRIGEKEGFNLILNASKANPVAGDVVFSKDVADVTAQVLVSLNATRPALPDTPLG
jgi:outer membrane protein